MPLKKCLTDTGNDDINPDIRGRTSPDGTVFDIPDDATVLPIRRPGATETKVMDNKGSLARYQPADVDVDDTNAGLHD